MCFSFSLWQVSKALIEQFLLDVMVLPDTLEEWRDVAMKFQIRWNFPHACGAIDGKHVAVKQPRKSGTMFFNYKGV